MGEIANMMLEGILCELCGVYIGEEVGFPRKCKNCTAMTKEKPRKRKRPKKENNNGK